MLRPDLHSKEELQNLTTEELREYADKFLLSCLDTIDKSIARDLEERREISRHYLSVGQMILERVKNKG